MLLFHVVKGRYESSWIRNFIQRKNIAMLNSSKHIKHWTVNTHTISGRNVCVVEEFFSSFWSHELRELVWCVRVNDLFRNSSKFHLIRNQYQKIILCYLSNLIIPITDSRLTEVSHSHSHSTNCSTHKPLFGEQCSRSLLFPMKFWVFFVVWNRKQENSSLETHIP